MWFLIVPILSLLMLGVGVFLIFQRNVKPWFLWAGIALVVLYVLSLPVVLPFFAVAMLLIFGASFGP